MIGEAWSNDSLRISGVEAVIVAVFLLIVHRQLADSPVHIVLKRVIGS